MKGTVCQADIVEMDKELQGKNLYRAEESDVARMCLALVSVGVKKRTVRMLSEPIDSSKFKEYWNHLEKAGYFANGSGKPVDMESLEESDIPFVLMILTAQGKLERKKEA